MTEASYDRIATLAKVKELGRKNKQLADINKELRESLEFVTETKLCRDCNENACPIKRALRKARGEE